MTPLAFAGRYAPRGRVHGDDPRRDLEQCLREDGPASSLAEGSLALAWTEGIEAQTAKAPGLCVLYGQPDVAELAGELGVDPGLPSSRIIQSGFHHLGDRVLEHLTGGYCLLVWSPAERRGLLARDRHGEAPLFLAESNGTLHFASEIRNLLALLPRRPEPDSLAVSGWLTGTRAGDDRTLYEGIRRLSAGHALRLHPDGWERFRHWRPIYAPARAADPEQAAAAVWSGLRAAVGQSLTRADRPGLMLSGGLDSSAVSAAALDLRGAETLVTYSSVFPGRPEVDERPRIALVRNWLGLRGVEAAFARGSVLAAAIEFMTTWEVPSASPNLFIWLPLLRRAAADGIDVMLDGEGGDELFGCPVYLLADRLTRGRLLDVLTLARRLPGMGERPQSRWLLRALAKYGLRGALPHGPHQRLRRARGRPLAPWLSETAIAAHQARDDPWAWKGAGQPRWWRQLSWLLTDRADALGASDQFRREAALTGLTLRHPLRDPALIELVLGLAPELSFDARLDRPLARRALRGRLPTGVLASEEKPAFNSLLTVSLNSGDRPGLQALLRNPHPELARNARAGGLPELLHGRPTLTWATDLWRLASLELWLDHQFRPERVHRVRELLDPVPSVAFAVREPATSPRPPAI